MHQSLAIVNQHVALSSHTPLTVYSTPMQLALALVLAAASCALALNNGAARTPPMGWLSWEMYRYLLLLYGCDDDSDS